MRTKTPIALAATGLLLVFTIGIAAVLKEPPMPQRTALEKLVRDGNFKDALEGYRKLILDARDDPRQVGADLVAAIGCLNRLGRVEEVDDLRDRAIEMHKGNWRLLETAAVSLLEEQGFGFMVAGKFSRGNQRGGGDYVSSSARDRARALQLLVSCLAPVRRDPDRAGASEFYFHLAQAIMGSNAAPHHGMLQTLTDLGELPDYEPWASHGWGGNQAPGAPVDEEGNPVQYRVPKSFEQASNDGERFRWALAQAVEANAGRLNEARWARAQFLQVQFGVQTSAQVYGEEDDNQARVSNPLAVGTLRDDETIAKLATGVRRFTLPDEFNPIRVFQSIADDPRTGYGKEALIALAQIFADRQQLDRSAEFWTRSLKQYGEDPNSRQSLNQILGQWGQFDATKVQPAGRGATLQYRFRNGRHVDFQAFALRIPALLDDLKAYLKGNPPQLDWNKVNIPNIGYRLVEQNERAYVGPEVARWGLDLRPPAGHLDARVTVTTPLQKPGAYLLRAQMANGNVSRIIVWIDDTVIVKKPLNGKTYVFVADAVTGRPVADADVELFAYRQVQVDGKNAYRIETKTRAEKTDADGQVIADLNDANGMFQFQWLITARAAGHRFAHLGFTNFWRAAYADQEYNQEKIFTITDRPVYRPNQIVKFKFWVRHAQYDQEDTSSFAGQQFPLEIHGPKGEKVFTKTFTADAYGGFDGSFELPSGATLGVYQIVIPNRGGGSFRVEEYKKPEFEVSVEAPTKPVMLGEKVEATIRAKYYFGAPVTQARVKYKVLRTSSVERWYPSGTWDWFYGRGYWWFAGDYPWYPGWGLWGCRRPVAWWWSQAQAPPEVVAEAELPIGADGILRVPIDTALAKATHADQDHRYEITAEVVDQSRRTIVGMGTVLVARKPYSVFTWVDRGYYRVGDTIRASLSAQTLDHKPVKATGTLRLLQVSYDAKGQPRETPVQEWPLETDDQGLAQQEIKASAAGQYRISAKLQDDRGHAIEGGYLLTVRGEGFDGHEFRFNDLELIADRREYQPGVTVRLMVNTNRAGGTVLLFARPSNGVYLPPKVLHLSGKSTVEELAIVKKDMPNVFVEAVTISDGKLHSEVKEIVVPPESRVLNVQAEPSKARYKPGEKATIKLKLTDPQGKPFVGSTALAVYDKSVDYIAGGSNVADIKTFFWKWRRSHSTQNETNLDLSSANLTRSQEVAMQPIGIFSQWANGNNIWGWNGQAFRRGMMGWGMGGMGGGMGGMGGAQWSLGLAVSPGSSHYLASARAPMRMDASLVSEAAAAAGADKRAPFGNDQLVDGATPEMQVEPTIRKNFADTAYWAGAIQTREDGTAEVEVEMPESLTTWKVKVWAMGHGTKVGQGDSEVVTTKDLLVRLQAPRFFVQKDEVVLSANVHNKLKSQKSVQVALELEGGTLVPLGESVQTVDIAADAELRVDWRVKVVKEGEALVRMKALTDEESDAMEMRFPAYVHGMLKTESWSGAIRPGGESAELTVRVPSERRPEQTRLEIRYSPTLAGAMVDALPYLADYPYGCTEQTLNRFLPAVITQKVLMDMGLDLKAIRDKRTNLNAQELGDAAGRAKRWKRFERNPVFDEAEVAAMVKAGLQRLGDMQLGDGGWGWFSGYGEHAWPHTTALVVHGLQLARRNDVALPPNMLERGVAWLTRYQDEQLVLLRNFGSKDLASKEKADDLDAFVFMILTEAAVKSPPMLEALDVARPTLSAYAKAMFGMAVAKLDDKVRLTKVLENLSQFVVQDDENQTAFLKLPNEGSWWYWYGDDTEANACYLRLLARTDPKGETTARLAKYLINHRPHASYWNSTRDTAFCIEALAEFLKASGEARPDLTVTVAVDGKVRKEVRITPADLFTFDSTFVLEGEAVATGEHTISFHKEGNGPLYFNAYLTNFTLEDPIARAGLEIKVDRKVYKLLRKEKTVKVAGARGQAVGQRVEAYRREELKDLATLKSGDLVEVELAIDSKNDYEYLIFEDSKAAGFEPVEIRSGYNGNALGAYMELRDERVAFFVRSLARGKHSVAYRLRAEIPGRFSALPTKASAMYAPELKANSDEIKLQIED